MGWGGTTTPHQHNCLTFFFASFLTCCFLSALMGLKIASLLATETSSSGWMMEALGGSNAGEPMGERQPRSSRVEPRWPRGMVWVGEGGGGSVVDIVLLARASRRALSQQAPGPKQHNDKDWYEICGGAVTLEALSQGLFTVSVCMCTASTYLRRVWSELIHDQMKVVLPWPCLFGARYFNNKRYPGQSSCVSRAPSVRLFSNIRAALFASVMVQFLSLVKRSSL